MGRLMVLSLTRLSAAQVTLLQCNGCDVYSWASDCRRAVIMTFNKSMKAHDVLLSALLIELRSKFIILL